MQGMIDLERRYGARNYDPLPVVLSRGEGVWLWDVDGRRYLDMLSAYSAVSFGYGHPRLLAALYDQAQRLAVTSRAFHSDRNANCSSGSAAGWPSTFLTRSSTMPDWNWRFCRSAGFSTAARRAS